MIFIQPEISLMRLALVKGSGGVECKQEANKRSLHKIHHPDTPLPHAVITITPQLIPHLPEDGPHVIFVYESVCIRSVEKFRQSIQG